MVDHGQVWLAVTDSGTEAVFVFVQVVDRVHQEASALEAGVPASLSRSASVKKISGVITKPIPLAVRYQDHVADIPENQLIRAAAATASTRRALSIFDRTSSGR